jgi:hypothetical protein
MQKLSNFTFGALIAGLLLLPLSAYAIGVPFGGLIAAETPCHIGPAPALWINVLGFSFIDMIGTTIPYPLYAPVVGEFILGQADTPLTCFVGTVPLPPGLRIQMFGNSGL